MTNIAFFGDDDVAGLCARLTSIGLAPLAEQTILALPPDAQDRDGAATPDGMSVVDLSRCPDVSEVASICDLAGRSGVNMVAALPLDRLMYGAVRNRFDAVITVGAGQAAGARALRAARYEAAAVRETAGPLPVPAWFLAGSDQPILITKARLSSVHGPRLPFATRSLPMFLPRLTRHDLDGLRSWEPQDPVLATATLLAALTLVIAADPAATRIEAADLAALMAADGGIVEQALATRLGVLAKTYGQTADSIAGGRMDRREARSVDRRTQGTRAGIATLGGIRSPVPRVLRSYR